MGTHKVFAEGLAGIVAKSNIGQLPCQEQYEEQNKNINNPSKRLIALDYMMRHEKTSSEENETS